MEASMTIFWQRWLHAWCWGIIAFGALLTACVIPALSGPARFIVDLAFWPLDGQPTLTARDAVLSLSVAGAVTLGWGVLMLGLVRDPVLSSEPRVWSLMTTALVIWFMVDSAASILAGAHVNALSNLLLTAGWVIPVVASGVLAAPSARPATN
jgi:hypothetical protein